MNQTYHIKVGSGQMDLPRHAYHHHRSPHSRPPSRARRWIKEFFGFIGLFIFFFIVSALVVMGPTIYSKISYYFFAPAIEEKNENMGLPASSPDYQTIAPKLQEKPKPVATIDKLMVPKISVDAPIVFVQTADNKTILDSLQNGVAHYPGTAMPGQVGNVFITGHSSYYWWSGGKYNRIFAVLDKLKADDLVYIYYQGEEYIYKVRDSIVVLPHQTEVLKPTVTATLSLMTCVPVGTNLKRLIVRADLISSPARDISKITEFADIPKIPVFLPL